MMTYTAGSSLCLFNDPETNRIEQDTQRTPLALLVLKGITPTVTVVEDQGPMVSHFVSAVFRESIESTLW